MGRPRTPTRILQLTGSKRAKYNRSATEPKPGSSKPTTNIKLNTTERRIFDATCKKIAALQLQASTDGNSVARYAQLVNQFNKLKAFCDKNGHSYTANCGDPRRRPESQQLNETAGLLLRLEREFGLTPSARAGLQADVPTVDDLERKFRIV